MPHDASCFNGGNLNGQFDATCFESAKPPNAVAPQVGKPAHATVLRNALAPPCPMPSLNKELTKPTLCSFQSLFLDLTQVNFA
jgi:hypothetical protein